MPKETDPPVVVVVPGDLHLTEPGRENARVARWAVGEINQLIRPAFVQFIGDILFTVDPTGRYTAFPEKRPVVSQTRFC
jgi:hypothetical protein